MGLFILTIHEGVGVNRYEQWCENNKLSRQGGPAIMYDTGLAYWVISGVFKR